jgi:hypothetical protein
VDGSVTPLATYDDPRDKGPKRLLIKGQVCAPTILCETTVTGQVIVVTSSALNLSRSRFKSSTTCQPKKGDKNKDFGVDWIIHSKDTDTYITSNEESNQNDSVEPVGSSFKKSYSCRGCRNHDVLRIEVCVYPSCIGAAPIQCLQPIS